MGRLCLGLLLLSSLGVVVGWFIGGFSREGKERERKKRRQGLKKEKNKAKRTDLL